MTDDERDDSAGQPMAIVLDVLPHGRSDDDRPQYQKEPLAYALDTDQFSLYEFIIDGDADISIADRIDIYEDSFVGRVNEIGYADLPSGATSELDYVIEDLVEEHEDRFVDVYNDAQPITLRLHQLNLLPGIGKKLRNNILDQRKRTPFESFEELQERVDGLHNPQEILVERIMEKHTEDDLKYGLFVRHDEQ
jgi:putative nucleotide binding protein